MGTSIGGPLVALAWMIFSACLAQAVKITVGGGSHGWFDPEQQDYDFQEEWADQQKFYVNDVLEKMKSRILLGAVFITSSIGGLGILALIALIVIWKLLKQVRARREIQEELAARKVQPPFYSFGDLKIATRGFHKDNELGSGAFGVVYKGIMKDGNPIAVKRLFYSSQNQVLHDFLNEVVLITGIKHRNLIQLLGCCVKDRERILVYEFAENGNLGEALWGPNKMNVLDWPQHFNICLGVARGLAYLHEELQPRIIHRDIKSVNTLLDKTWNSKIADFGLAKPFEDEFRKANFTHVAGTKGYLAPEYVLDSHLMEKADVFSFGILLLEIISGRKCIDLNKPEEQVYLKTWAEQLNQNDQLEKLIDAGIIDTWKEEDIVRAIHIALICVRRDANSRATMSQVVIMLLGDMDVTQSLIRVEKKPVDFSILMPIRQGNLSEESEITDLEADEASSPLMYVSKSPSTLQSST